MKKILILTSSYPSSEDQVNRTFMSDLASSLSDRSLRVFVLCPHQEGLPFREIQNSVTIIRFPYWFSGSGERLGKTGGIIASVSRSPLAVIQLIPFCICQFLKALTVIREEQIDLVHSHWIVPQGLIGAVIRACTSLPHITSIHGTDIHLIHPHRSAYPVVKLIQKYSNLITVNSSHTGRLVLEIVHDRESTRIIPMGIHPDEFRRRECRSSSTHMTILFVGRLIGWKGAEYLIQAVQHLKSGYPQVRLVIVGDGPDREKLERLCSDPDISPMVTFTGRVNRETLLSWYRDADIFVLPSVTVHNQTEGLGVVLLEAMASGVPVIGSDTGGIPDIIRDNVNGLLVPPKDPRALASAILRIIQDPALATRLSLAGIETVRERFSWDVIAEQFTEIYLKAINNPEHNSDRP